MFIRSTPSSDGTHPMPHRLWTGFGTSAPPAEGDILWSWTEGKVREAVLCLAPLNWESSILKESRWGLKWMRGRTPGALNRAALGLPSLFRKSGAVSVFIRLPMSEHPLIQLLERGGFRYVGGLSTLRMRSGPAVRPQGPPVPLRPAEDRDASQLEKIAREAFKEGRFYNEPGLGRAGAKAIYSAWARNSAKKNYADRVIVAGRSKVLGFVTLKKDEAAKRLWIDLIAVSPAAQGKGVGSRLIAASVRANRGAKGWTLGVKTQTENLGALRFYMRNGFEPEPFKLDYVWR